ncbi:MAG: peroxidase-related enzyme [Acidimicrobiales bacterium]|nr:peroxidase-related enzyme [Acidimicrobiales bacterium]
MAHIDLPEGLPGILGPMHFRPETAKPLNDLAEVLLRGPSTLSRGERELIAAAVSRGNDCHFCHSSHATFAALQIDGGWETVDAVIVDRDGAPITPKLRALLAIADKVRVSGREVGAADIAAARDAGATDVEIHDAVLIAAAFCMFNRYVDGLGTWAPPERSDYEDNGRMIVEHGYAATSPPVD